MMVTSRVTTAPHIEFIIIPFLGIITGHVSLALLADNIADKTSFTLEVITDSIGFVGGVPVFEDRSSLGCSYRIDHATGKNRTVVHIHRDDISLQVSTRITHLSLAVKMGKATLRKYNGVIGFVGYGSIQCILLGRRSRYRILLQRIGRKPFPLAGSLPSANYPLPATCLSAEYSEARPSLYGAEKQPHRREEARRIVV